ncbi:uncharacterized protein LOC135327793 isoform X1 [Dromaius novaehollandiae]|uniref:uncharacterized protein LOC135327793 isoform X1 n=2 Tax=Dromaius novaehollandiae TaxID=8790 RepID=UPI00311FAAD9
MNFSPIAMDGVISPAFLWFLMLVLTFYLLLTFNKHKEGSCKKRRWRGSDEEPRGERLLGKGRCPAKETLRPHTSTAPLCLCRGSCEGLPHPLTCHLPFQQPFPSGRKIQRSLQGPLGPSKWSPSLCSAAAPSGSRQQERAHSYCPLPTCRYTGVLEMLITDRWEMDLNFDNIIRSVKEASKRLTWEAINSSSITCDSASEASFSSGTSFSPASDYSLTSTLGSQASSFSGESFSSFTDGEGLAQGSSVQPVLADPRPSQEKQQDLATRPPGREVGASCHMAGSGLQQQHLEVHLDVPPQCPGVLGFHVGETETTFLYPDAQEDLEERVQKKKLEMQLGLPAAVCKSLHADLSWPPSPPPLPAKPDTEQVSSMQRQTFPGKAEFSAVELDFSWNGKESLECLIQENEWQQEAGLSASLGEPQQELPSSAPRTPQWHAEPDEVVVPSVQELPFLDNTVKKQLELHIIKMQMKQRFGPPARIPACKKVVAPVAGQKASQPPPPHRGAGLPYRSPLQHWTRHAQTRCSAEEPPGPKQEKSRCPTSPMSREQRLSSQSRRQPEEESPEKEEATDLAMACLGQQQGQACSAPRAFLRAAQEMSWKDKEVSACKRERGGTASSSKDTEESLLATSRKDQGPGTQGDVRSPCPPSQAEQALLQSEEAHQGQLWQSHESWSSSSEDMRTPELPSKKSVPQEKHSQSRESWSVSREDMETPELPAARRAPPRKCSQKRQHSEEGPSALPPAPAPAGTSVPVSQLEGLLTALIDSHKASQAAHKAQNQLLEEMLVWLPDKAGAPRKDTTGGHPVGSQRCRHVAESCPHCRGRRAVQDAPVPAALPTNITTNMSKDRNRQRSPVFKLKMSLEQVCQRVLTEEPEQGKGRGNPKDRASSRRLCPKCGKARRQRLSGKEGLQTSPPSDAAALGAGRAGHRHPPQGRGKRQQGQEERAAATQQAKGLHLSTTSFLRAGQAGSQPHQALTRPLPSHVAPGHRTLERETPPLLGSICCGLILILPCLERVCAKLQEKSRPNLARTRRGEELQGQRHRLLEAERQLPQGSPEESNSM